MLKPARMLEDLGTTFNVYRDVGGAGQPYEIDPIPFIMERQEWDIVAKGLAQRMRLLEAVLADLYGARLLLKDGLVPPDLVHASPAFHHSTRDIQPSGKKWLLASGCDLVRGVNGVWTVLSDHTHTPGGLGQTLENRSVVSAVLPDLFEQAQVAKLKPFFDDEHARSAGSGNEQRRGFQSGFPDAGLPSSILFRACIQGAIAGDFPGGGG